MSGNTMSELDPVGVKGHITPENSVMRTLGTGPYCTNTRTLITQQTMFALPPLQFPPFIKGFTVRGWENKCLCVLCVHMCLCLSPGSVANPCGPGYLIESVLEGFSEPQFKVI